MAIYSRINNVIKELFNYEFTTDIIMRAINNLLVKQYAVGTEYIILH